MKITHNIVQAFFIAMILFSAAVLYKKATAQTLHFDPMIAGQTHLTIECAYPIEREDGTALSVDEIARIEFYINDIAEPVASNDTACRQVFDLRTVADGSYLYSMKTVDKQERKSIKSPEVIEAVVKRIASPNPATGVVGTRH
jgi:hypothetical protein